VKELAANVALDFTRAFLADATKRVVTKALLTKLATTNKVLYTAVGRFGMVSGTFVSAIVGMVGEELLDWILKGDASGLKRLADHPEVLLERGAQCVAGQLLGEAFSWAFAAVGSVFGPIGTAIGKALGFVVGYAIGYCVVGKIMEARRNRDARNFVLKGRYFKARSARWPSRSGFDGWDPCAREAEDLAEGITSSRRRRPPPDAKVAAVADGDSAEARTQGETGRRRSPLRARRASGLLLKRELDETASFLRAFEADYEEKLDRGMKRMDDDAWEQALNAGPALDGALDRYRGTVWYEKIRRTIESTDLIDPELNLWSYDRHSDRLVRLGPAFVGDVKETLFVTRRATVAPSAA
jgi:hypothetical protein